MDSPRFSRSRRHVSPGLEAGWWLIGARPGRHDRRVSFR